MVIVDYHLVNTRLSCHLSPMPIYWTLRDALKRAGIPPGTLAAQAGLHRQSLYAILKTPRAERIDADTLARLCKALDCQPGDLLSYRRSR